MKLSHQSWKRIEAVVDQALDLDEAGRRSLLERLAVEDPQLGGELDAFLEAERAARGLLTAPVDEHAPGLLGALAVEPSSWDALQLEGETVGPYRISRELGRGGMGAVFFAERADGEFEQQVALKLVKRGMDSAEILDRFRAERQILARLQHPHIARLLDGGVCRDGQPYFAMEHVAGVPLTVYCDGSRLSIDDRLRLFLQVCDALDYAHRNLVVHRDLKPSNILITPDGQAKLLDFGIAKVLDPSTADGAVTRDGRAMTPLYAAPEQLLGQAVTTATDVYALGVTLYQVLSGRHPWRVEGLDAQEIQRAVLEREPEPLPSAVQRVERRADPESPPDDAEEIARARGLGVEQLRRRLRGDLDTVVQVALRREPERRYPSVRAMAEDLRRHLEGRPVSARADRLSYRAWKFVRRHRWTVSGAALLALSLLAGLLGTLWQAREALRQARKADEVKRFTLSLFELSDPDAAQGKEITARQLLERSAQRIDAELATQPEIQAEMLLVVGDIYHRLGMNRESLPLFERALELRRRRLDADDLGMAEAEVAVGGAHLLDGELDKAQSLLESGLTRRRRSRGDDHPETARAGNQLGQLHFERGDLAGARVLLEEAVRVQRLHLPSTGAELATSLSVLGRVLQTQGELDGAERLHQEALGIRRRLHGDEHTTVVASVLNVAAVLQERGDFPAAESRYREVVAVDRRLLGPSSEGVAVDLNNLATVLIIKGSYREADALLREALEIRRRLHGQDSPQLATNLHNLARALRFQGRLDEAESSSRRAIALASARLGDEHTSVATMRGELARTLHEKGDLGEAEVLARRTLATYRRQLSTSHPRVAEPLVTLGRVLLDARRAEEAEALLREATALRRLRFGERDWRTAESRVELGACLSALGRRREADDELTAGHQGLSTVLGLDHPLTRRAQALLKPTARGSRGR